MSSTASSAVDAREGERREASGTTAVDEAAQPAPVSIEAGGSVAPAMLSSEAGEKVTTFNAKRIAAALQARERALVTDVQRLMTALEEVAGLEVAEVRARISELGAIAEQMDARVASLRQESEHLANQILVSRDRISLEEVGLFDFENPAEASARLSTQLEVLRSRIREANKIGRAITATDNFTFNNSLSKGKTFVNQMSRIMLRAYNAEAENAIKSVKAGNLSSAQKRLSTAKEQISKQGRMIDLSVTDQYHAMRLKELELAARHLAAVAVERERERERRAELREQRQLELEIKREKEKLEKERAHYLNSIERLRSSGDEEGALALQSELDRIDKEIADADYRAANIRAGYVYVISNLGAFGDGVVKIGMTRRLDPMDRIRELGDASVPFTFDVHALFFADDAVGIEAMLHREFADSRINKVNLRREFFRVSPQAVLDALREHRVSVLEFDTHAAADDYRMSWPDGYPLRQDGASGERAPAPGAD